MLIRRAELDGALRDVRIVDGLVAQISTQLPVAAGETVFDADGGALLPGLHDHHLHLFATAAAFASLPCGPPQIADLNALASALHEAPNGDWVRGVGYHDSIGAIDRSWLDRNGPARPIRIQHRGGRMWVLNSLAMRRLGAGAPPDGRLIDGDAWLASRRSACPPDLRPVGAELARFGVTGITETTPRNRLADYEYLAQAGLPQNLLIMGGPDLLGAPRISRAHPGALKLHYHDYQLPGLDALADEINAAHASGRVIAAHCVTTAELLLTLAALEIAGSFPGDRIEHAAVTVPEALRQMAELGVTVVTQPHFIAERAAAYRAEVDLAEQPFLYRLQGFIRAGIKLAAGSDAPFGGLNPWASMAAAVDRLAGFGEDEALSSEQALALYTGSADQPGGVPRRVVPGAPASLCLLAQSWVRARENLGDVTIRATFVDGVPVYDSMASTNPQASAVIAETRRIESAI